MSTDFIKKYYKKLLINDQIVFRKSDFIYGFAHDIKLQEEFLLIVVPQYFFEICFSGIVLHIDII